jgi:hypothetical protein
MKRNKYTTVPAEDFVRIWQESPTMAEVMDKMAALGNTSVATAVAQRAAKFRKMGVPLKMFGGGRRKEDWKALAALAKKCAKS